MLSYQTAPSASGAEGVKQLAKHNDRQSALLLNAAAYSRPPLPAATATGPVVADRAQWKPRVLSAACLARSSPVPFRLGLPPFCHPRRTMVSPTYCSPTTTDGRRYSRPYPPYFLPDRRYHLTSHHENRSVTMTGPPTESGDTPPRKRIAVAVGPRFFVLFLLFPGYMPHLPCIFSAPLTQIPSAFTLRSD